MANIRQTILIRTDLQLPVGLLAAQVAHIHFEAFRQMGLNPPSEHKCDYRPPLVCEGFESVCDRSWLESPYVFVHGVPNLETLNFFATKAHENEVKMYPWRDTIYLSIAPGMTQAFGDVLVGVALGPADSDKIKMVIGQLPLL